MGARFWVALVIVGSTISAAQQTPNASRFRPEGLYDYSGFDEVSIFSGGLSAQIPILTFGAEFQIPLTLQYSSSAWEAFPTTCPPTNEICGATMRPKPFDLAGLGFAAHFGALYQPSFGSAYAVNRWVFALDGAEHSLYPRLHPDDPQDSVDASAPPGAIFERVMYSRDSSSIRAVCDSANFGNCTVETMDGLRRFFRNVNFGVSDPKYQLESITDRFGNEITIEYLTNPVRWRIRDGYTAANPGREVVLTFAPPPSAAADQPLLLQTIEAPCYLADDEQACRGESGSKATWTFQYPEDPVLTNPPSVYGQSPEERGVWFLESLELPDGSTYAFEDYATELHGGLERVVLPTKGQIGWDWSSLSLPAVRNDPTCPAELPPNAEYWSNTYAIHHRTEMSSGGTTLGDWYYTRTPDVEEGLGVGEILSVDVENPLHHVSRYFFSIWAANFCYVPEHGSAQWEYGLPYSRADSDPMASTPQRYLSAEHFNCSGVLHPDLDPEAGECTKKRSEYVAYEIDDGDSVGGWNNGEVHDRNRRVRSQRTLFHEASGNKYRLSSMSDWDGLGHFRSGFSSSNISDISHPRTSMTSWNDGRGTYTGLPGQVYDPVDWDELWVLNTFKSQSVTEAGVALTSGGTATQTAKSEACFDDEGFLERTRAVESSAGGIGASDLLHVRVRNAQGHLTREEWYGGDRLDDLDVTPGTHVCDISLPAQHQYRVDHGYAVGLRASSQWKDSSGGTTGGLNFLALDLTIDGRTGLARASRDISGIETKFIYDSSSRILEVHGGEGAAWEDYSYINASGAGGGFNGAQVEHRAFDYGDLGGAVLKEEHWVYEDLGRLRRERRLAKDGQYDDRFRYYDGAGHQTYLSEWGRGATTANFGLEWTGFDAFDRPGAVGRYSNNVFFRTEAEMAYVGDYRITRKQWIATSEVGAVPVEAEVNRVESFDEHGRLEWVEELSDGASPVKTTYGYDVGGRLRLVRTPITGGGEQRRWFLYDQRGFLDDEIVPEKGASGNGSVDYQQYDPLGNSWRRIDGNQLDYTFDRAGRITGVDETIQRPGLSAIIRPLKTFGYGAANMPGSFELGKLNLATSFNWIDTPGVSYDARFVEAFQYTEVGGARSHRAVSLYQGLADGPLEDPWLLPPQPARREVFRHEEHFDALGQRTSVVYPTCQTGLTGGNCDTGQPVLTVSSTFTKGFLAAVSDAGFDWVSDATYHNAGLWKSMNRGNGVVESQSIDPLKIPRPGAIEAKYQTTTLWSTGTMSYDRSGNLTQLATNEEGGSDLFLYDPVSRLKEARIHVPAQLGSLVFSDGFESGSSARWLEAWPPAGWASGQRTQKFTFDRFGNLTKVENVGGATENFQTSGSTNRMTSGAAYDARGNLTSFDGKTNAFDSLNRQWKRLNPDTSADYFLYTADDERILTFTTSGGPAFRWALRDFDGKVLRTYNSSGSVNVAMRDYIHAGEHLLGSQVSINPTVTRMVATTDQLGTPRLWTDPSGESLRKHKYLPFGEEATPSDQWDVALQFTGHERDNNDLSLDSDDGDYMHARFGALAGGRLASVDPVLQVDRAQARPQGWNRYSYALGNPLLFTDPTGADVSIMITFVESEERAFSKQQKAMILNNVRAFWSGLGVGSVHVFDSAEMNQTNFPGTGVAAQKVSPAEGNSHPSMVLAGDLLNDPNLNEDQKMQGTANKVNHEVFAHWFGFSPYGFPDAAYFDRGSYAQTDPGVVARNATVLDSQMVNYPDSKRLMISGPMPVFGPDLARAQNELNDVRLRPPSSGPNRFWKW